MFMNLVEVLSIWEKLEEWSEGLKQWIFANYSNPLLWIGIVGGGFLIFKAVFSALNTDR